MRRVLIAGGGVAGLEALLALRDLAGNRVELTFLTPGPEFVFRPMAVAEPFGRGHAERHPLVEFASDLGATLIPDVLAEVDPDHRVAITGTRRRLSYDALLIAVGARSEPAFRGTLTWTPETDAELFGGLLRDLDEGYLKHVAFVVPYGVSWPLPAYELALMTAWHAWGMGHNDIQVTIYTHEDTPLGLFGAHATAALRDDLDQAGIRAETGRYVAEDPKRPGQLIVHPGGQPLAAQRIVALPRPVGPALPGLPTNAHGFIPTDLHGRVPGVDAVWAAGDATAFPVKQGGLAAQQADAAAESIAANAGAPFEPRPFHPVLRGMMLTGRGTAWMRRDTDGDDEGTAVRRALWWPPTKIAGRYLSPYLAARHGTPVAGERPQPDGQPVDLDLARAVPAAAGALGEARRASETAPAHVADNRGDA